MNYRVFKLNEYDNRLTDYPTVKEYLHEKNREFGEDRKYPAMIVFPGGGYRFTSEREAEPIAMKFYAEGYNVFVLYYTIYGKGKVFPNALLEGATLIDYVRQNANELDVDSDKIAVIGFSAGAHLAGSVSNRFDDKIVTDFIGRDVRPNASILCYPVISGGEFAHRGSFEKLTDSEDLALHCKEGVENFVSEKTPPTFMFHTADDKTVPVENSLIMGLKLAKFKIPFEYHVYRSGVHGLSLATKMTNIEDEHIARWFENAVRFLKDVGVSL